MTDPGKPLPEPTLEDRRLLYGVAHHDVWACKGQQWNVTNWALVLIGATVGVVRSVPTLSTATIQTTWPFLAMIIVIAGAALVYLPMLQAQIVYNRSVYRVLEATTGIERLRAELPAPRSMAPDRLRGVELLYIMVVVIAGGVALAGMMLALSLVCC